MLMSAVKKKQTNKQTTNKLDDDDDDYRMISMGVIAIISWSVLITL